MISNVNSKRLSKNFTLMEKLLTIISSFKNKYFFIVTI